MYMRFWSWCMMHDRALLILTEKDHFSFRHCGARTICDARSSVVVTRSGVSSFTIAIISILLYISPHTTDTVSWPEILRLFSVRKFFENCPSCDIQPLNFHNSWGSRKFSVVTLIRITWDIFCAIPIGIFSSETFRVRRYCGHWSFVYFVSKIFCESYR